MIARKEGATLGLIPCIILVVALIGICFYYLATFFGGSKQLVNGTDSAVLGAAREILAVGLNSSEVTALPSEFQALGVDNTGAPIGITSAGAPDVSNGIYNVYAFNRAAGYTLLVALNAAEDGSSTAINNANYLIGKLNTFGNKLNADLAGSTQLTSVFNNLAGSNTPNMLGNSSAISLGNDFQFASVPDEGTGLANIYFNSAIYANDTTMQGWINQITSSTGVTSQKNSRYNQNDPSAQAGQPFVLAYQTLNLNTITNNNGATQFSPNIFTCAVNPSQMPHMIDPGRFNNPGTPNSCYAPNNSISAQGLATASRNGNNLVSGTNFVCSALACAMLGAYDNQYPIGMPFGWIRIQNGKDAIAANPNLSPVPIYSSNGDTIYNDQLYYGPGGKGGIYTANFDSAQHAVFCTESFDNESNAADEGPPGYSGSAELSAWVNYTTTPCTGSCVPDTNGLNPALNPNVQASNGLYGSTLGYQSPTVNLRYSGYFGVTASITNLLAVNQIANYCDTNNIATTPACQSNEGWQVDNYFQAGMPLTDLEDNGTQATGGLTNVEYVKGEIVGALDHLWATTSGEGDPNFDNAIYTLTLGTNPSGSKAYGSAPSYVHNGTPYYATPSDVDSVAFGTVAKPLDLITQLNSNGPDQLCLGTATTGTTTTCADTSSTSTQWTDVSTPLGALLQRCQMICPGTTVAQLLALLNTNPIDLHEYQYIYLPVGGSALIISKTPPPFLQPYTEYNSPGTIVPDGSPDGAAAGTPTLSCYDTAWGATGNGNTTQNVMGSMGSPGGLINTQWLGTGSNTTGDDTTSGSPYSDFTGSVSTWDGLSWTPSSGRYFFLGQMSFGNYIQGDGTIQMSSPN